MKVVTILVVDDEPLVRDALVALLESVDDFRVVGAVGDGPSAVAAAAEHHPDLAVIDVRMPGGGPVATRGVLQQSPSTRVVALSAYEERWAVMAMVQAGAIGYLLKGELAGALVEALREIAAGRPQMSPEVAGQVLDELATHLRTREEADEQRREKQEDIERLLAEPAGIMIALQPVLALESGAVVGLEALARFGGELATRGTAAVFADAWEVGLGIALEKAALAVALAELPALPERVWLSLNLSPATMTDPELPALLEGVPLPRLVFEITEHAAVHDYQQLAEALTPLRRAGGRLAIDDAGAGFASLRHILRLSPDIIKLDATLTAGIDENGSQRALAVGLLGFAKELGAQVVAEGIETAGERRTLVELGVGLGQGYHLGRPELSKTPTL